MDQLNMSVLKDSLNALIQGVKAGNKAGVYTLDESYILKMSAMNLEKAVKVIEDSMESKKKDKDKDTVTVDMN